MAFITQPVPLVLASGSAIRAQMLKSVGLQFSVVPSGADEDALKATVADKPAAEQALVLARGKGKGVAAQYPDRITLSADQMCVLDGEILSKPGTSDKAIVQLTRMAGKQHLMISAACLMQGEEVLWETTEIATMSMRELTADEIRAYVFHDQPLQSCGSYKIEGMGRHLFRFIDGDMDVVKGLPLTLVLHHLHDLQAIHIQAQ